MLAGETRQATIRTSQEEGADEVVLLRLQRSHVRTILSEAKCAQALEIGRREYAAMARLKSSSVVAAVVQRFWNLMVRPYDMPH